MRDCGIAPYKVVIRVGANERHITGNIDFSLRKIVIDRVKEIRFI